MRLGLPEPPKVDNYGCYDVEDVLAFAFMVGEAQTAKLLNIAPHRLIFFKQKAKEPKRVNTSIHSLCRTHSEL